MGLWLGPRSVEARGRTWCRGWGAAEAPPRCSSASARLRVTDGEEVRPLTRNDQLDDDLEGCAYAAMPAVVRRMMASSFINIDFMMLNFQAINCQVKEFCSFFF